jgi:hypothetical protein
MSRFFGETRKETHLSLMSTHPMWILATGVSECDRNFSVFSELKLAAVVKNVSKIEENCLLDDELKSNLDNRGGAKERAYSISKLFFFTCTEGIKTGQKEKVHKK